MKAQIRRRESLADIPSASGVEVVGDLIYVVGDDSPYLYCLDHDWNLLRRLTLFETDEFASGRMGRYVKPDFEALTTLDWNGRRWLMALGSGSRSPQRDVSFLVDISDDPRDASGDVSIQRFMLTSLYDTLRAREEVVGSGRLNIEAAAADEDVLILFQRGNVTGKNVAIYYDLAEVMTYLSEPSHTPPVPELHAYDLPLLQGVRAGLSGACVLSATRQVLFTAAVEDTSTELEDGEVLGSFIGLLPLRARGETFDLLPPLATALTLDQSEQTYVGKIESIALLEAKGEGGYTVLAATDDDLGGSDLLVIEIDDTPSQT